MENQIKKLRNEIIQKLQLINEDVVIKLDYSPQIQEQIIFETSSKELIFDDFGHRREKSKIFALPKNILSKIDLSEVDFSNFNAKDFDFTGLHNVKLNPQTIWYKNLYGAILNGVEFIGPFDDIKIDNINFAGSKNAIIDITKIYGWKGLYNEFYEVYLTNCTFKDVTFTKPIKTYVNKFKKWIPKINKCDFSGSHNAIIYLNGIHFGVEECNLSDTTIVSPIICKNWCALKGTSFAFAKKQKTLFDKDKKVEIVLKYNQDCYEFDFTNTNFKGVHFKTPIKGCLLNNTSFQGSTGAIINFAMVSNKSKLDTCNFTDAKVFDVNGCEMTITEDGKLSKRFLYKLNESIGTPHTNELISKEKREELRRIEIKKKREEIAYKINEIVKLNESLENLGIEPNHLYGTIPISQELFLVQIDDHYEINRDVIDASLIRFFNLSMIDFSNVLVSGIDFRKSKARINPQIVYNKDISNCKFDSFNISPFTDFSNVIMENTDFSECEVSPNKTYKL